MYKTFFAYCAGFVDAEGCIRLTKNNSGFGLQVIFSQTKSDAILAINKHFFGSIHERKRSSGKRQLVLTLCGEDACKLLTAIAPYVRIKKDQVVEALNSSRLDSNTAVKLSELNKRTLTNIDQHTTENGYKNRKKNLVFSYKRGITSTDKAYCAGLFDGDGHIDVARTYLCAKLELTTTEGIEFIYNIYGGSIRGVKKTNPNCKPTLALKLKAQQTVFKFLSDILPYTHEKTAEIVEILERWHPKIDDESFEKLKNDIKALRSVELPEGIVDKLKADGTIVERFPGIQSLRNRRFEIVVAGRPQIIKASNYGEAAKIKARLES